MSSGITNMPGAVAAGTSAVRASNSAVASSLAQKSLMAVWAYYSGWRLK